MGTSGQPSRHLATLLCGSACITTQLRFPDEACVSLRIASLERSAAVGQASALRAKCRGAELSGLIARRSQVQVLPSLRREPFGHPHIPRFLSLWRDGQSLPRCMERSGQGVEVR